MHSNLPFHTWWISGPSGIFSVRNCQNPYASPVCHIQLHQQTSWPPAGISVSTYIVTVYSSPVDFDGTEGTAVHAGCTQVHGNISLDHPLNVMPVQWVSVTTCTASHEELKTHSHYKDSHVTSQSKAVHTSLTLRRLMSYIYIYIYIYIWSTHSWCF